MKWFASNTIRKMLFVALAFLLCLGVLVPLAVLITYYCKLGSFSGDPQNWSAFGSVMSGAFTLLAASSTTATFLLLIWQKKDADEVVAKQITAMQFEQYIKHRSLFMEALDGLEIRFGNVFYFRERDQLYKWFFPKNSAFHMSYKGAEFSEVIVGTLQTAWDNQAELIRRKESNHAESFCWALLRLHNQLGIIWQQVGRQGDVRVYETHIDDRGEKHIGLNLLNIKADLNRSEYIVRALLDFSGRLDLFEAMHRHLTDMCLLFDNLYGSVLEDAETNVRIQSKDNDRLSLIYEIYKYSKNTWHRGERVFDPIYSYVGIVLHAGGGDRALSSIDNLNEIAEACIQLTREVQKRLADKVGAEVDIVLDGLDFREIYVMINKVAACRKV